MQMIRALGVAWLCLLCSSTALAFDDLNTRLPAKGRLGAFFRDGDSRASVKDGPLLGHGRESVRVLPNGRIRLVRRKTYTRIRDPESGKIVKLPEPWHASSTLLLSPQVRLLKATTRLDFKRSIKKVLVDEDAMDQLERLFEWDEAVTTANRAGDQLTRVRKLRGAEVDRESYEYEPDDVPLEIVGMMLSVAVKNRVDRFDFDLLVPGGSTHGVRSRIHHTSNPAPFAKGYKVPARHRKAGARALAVVEMRLASPIKYLLFPHKFYMVYPTAEPDKLLAFWGGDPEEHMQAFRLEEAAVSAKAP